VGVVEKKQTSIFTLADIRTLAPLLIQAHTESKLAVVPQLPLEIAIIEATATASPSPVGEGVPLKRGRVRANFSRKCSNKAKQ